ncbi:insulin receptor substrate 1-B-like [Myxocyprinus asiaticus]|uniref:insulin receptor substrate 1-B-like n=1 Tax=Myxocyprinus asiaticus TaxID=70543 RepID=UPI0022235D12|nr:insulin receptor substrate 1-B-like [Myxocyprinus asiaticus]
MENQAAMEQQSYEDVRKSGYLRKQKSMHRRFFVLRAASEQGPARLEYYENEKKFRSKSPVPKKAVNLDSCFNINKRADSKNKHMIVLYSRGESFAIAADTEEVQNEWYQAMLDLQCKCKTPDDCGSGGDCGMPSPGPAFKEVWQVKVWPKGLGQARNLVGIYRLCLTDKTVNFVKLNSDVAAIVLQLMNVRRCGHSENFFFIEVGRSAMTGPGEFWMQVEDSVVAQNMHETLLEAMKALSEEFRQRSKSQTVGVSCGGGTASNPISVPSRRHHPNLPPSQVGFSRRARTETPGVPHSTNTSPTPRHGFSRSRTASIGARTEDGGGRATALSTSPSLNGSSRSTTPTLRPKPTRAPTPAKITLSLARYTPNPAPSPAPSLSSSSGHGSECGLGVATFGTVPICAYARIPQRVSMSGSPSDYGSSDEYGSSPGEHSLLATGLPAALVEGGASYILMGHREGSHKRAHGRRVLRRSSRRECEAERRLLSKRASLPPTSVKEGLVPHCREEEEEDEEDYAVMSRSASRESFTSRRGSGGSATTSLLQLENSADKGVSTKGGLEDFSTDSGYMSMLPGVTAPPASLSLSVSGSDVISKGGDEYMAMTPNSSVSPPQHICLPVNEGYMMMSPNSSCSPDLHGLSGYIWSSRGSMESRAGSDYMNMSPISARSACSTPPSHPEHQPLQPKMVYSYFSLPRSYKHTTLSTRFEDDLDRVCIGRGEREAGGNVRHSGYHCGGDTPGVSCGGGQLSLSSSSFSSSSASSESLEDRSLSLSVGGVGRESRLGTGHRVGGTHPKISHHHHQQRCGPGVQKQGQLQQRKDKSSSFLVNMSKANTLPRVKETLLPTASPSPGEYVSIVYQGERAGHYKGRSTVEPGNPTAQGPQRALLRPQPCQGGTANLPLSFLAPLSTSISLSSEYVNMDLGNSPSSLTHLSSFKPAPKVREELTRAPQVDQEVAHRKSRETDLTSADVAAAPFTDYTVMKFGSPKSPKPGQTPQPSSMEQEHNMNFPFTNVDQGARLVRAESSARRRHLSETFMTPPTLPISPSASPSPFPETPHGASPRQQGLESNLWTSGQPPSPQCASPGVANLPAAQTSSLALEQGLNYIDLDLVSKENSQTSVDGPSGPHSFYSPVVGGVGGAGGSTSSSINTYASIDFIKSQEMKVHKTSRKDNKDC